MKKAKKVISYILLIVPLSLPAACSPISSNSRYNNDTKKQEHGDADHLQLIVQNYFRQQDGQAQEEQEDAAPAPAESEQELKEELTGLERTGAWTDDAPNGGQAPVQCALKDKKEAPSAQANKKKGAEAICDFPITVNKQVAFYLDQFQGSQRKNFRRWLERSSIYLPLIAEEMQKARLPEELTYLAMIESGFNPSACSPAGATGLWQFVSDTGRRHGLRIDSWADERRDPEKSTKAAVAYLKALYRRFGDWQLTVAAYNAGEGKIEQGMRRYRAKTFSDLAQHDWLSLETRRYVPKLTAAVLIARDPEQYGFSQIRQKEPLQYDVVKVPGRTSLQAIAASALLPVSRLRDLNNALLQDQVPPGRGSYALKVPTGKGALVAANLAGVRTMLAAEYKTHRVKGRETLQQISRKYEVSMTDLLKANSLRNARLRLGQNLRIPIRSEQYVLLKKPAERVAANRSNSIITYTLGKGETLAKVSKKYNVSVAMLMQWNGIARAGKVKAGRQLTIHLADRAQSAAKTAVVALADKTVELKAQSRKRRPEAAQAARQRIPAAALAEAKKQKPGRRTAGVVGVKYYEVRNGDSLWSIAQKHEVSTREIKRWNSLSDNNIQPGTTLIIKNG